MFLFFFIYLCHHHESCFVLTWEAINEFYVITVFNIFFITLTVRSLISPSMNERKVYVKKSQAWIIFWVSRREHVVAASPAISHRIMNKWIALAEASRKKSGKQETQNYTTFNSPIHNNLNTDISDILSHCANLPSSCFSSHKLRNILIEDFFLMKWMSYSGCCCAAGWWLMKTREERKKNRKSSRRNVWEVREIKKKQKAEGDFVVVERTGDSQM